MVESPPKEAEQPAAVDLQASKESNESKPAQDSKDVKKANITYKTDYYNPEGSLIGSITSTGEKPSLASPNWASPVVLEIVTSLSVTKASKNFFEKFKDKGSVDLREKKDDDILVPEAGFVQNVEMVISSRKLIDALRAIIDYYEIEAYKSNHPPAHDKTYREETNAHIDVLLKFLGEQYREKVEAERSRYRRSPPVCTYQMLWLLFTPGEICYYYPTPGQLQAFVTKNFRYIEGAASHIFGWFIAFGGKSFGREPFDMSIAPFVGEKEISSLECFPNKFLKTANNESITDVRRRLVDRGRQYWNVWKPTYSDYNGTTANFPFRKIKGRVMVDSLSCFGEHPVEPYGKPSDLDRPVFIDTDSQILYRIPKYKEARDWLLEGITLDDLTKQTPGCGCSKCTEESSTPHGKPRFFGYHSVDPVRNDPPNEDEYFFLCSHRTFAFDLGARKWEVVNVSELNIDVRASDVFKDLALPEDVRNIVYELAIAYRNRNEDNARLARDMIRGKGEGRVFLLHGPPGVGKTLTAESVAELINRPLLSLTCGDLGTDGSEVERNLTKYLSWGLLWGAVVLLDEADVFLEQRDLADVGRNALVSVFLRALEYYSGFLFLTTNRVNTFDEAFISRIHIALHYKPLTNKQRRRIWENNIERLESNDAHVTNAAKAYVKDELVTLEWNGREIRNVFQTATALAQFSAQEKNQEVVMKRSHIERVVGLTSQFQKYLDSMNRGLTPGEVAMRRGLRNDMIDMPKKNQRQRQPQSTRGYSRRYEDEDDEEDEEVNGRRSRKPQVSNSKSLPPRFYDDEDGEEDEAESRIKKSSRKYLDSDEDATSQGSPRDKRLSNKNDDDDYDETDRRRRPSERTLKVPERRKAKNYREEDSGDED